MLAGWPMSELGADGWLGGPIIGRGVVVWHGEGREGDLFGLHRTQLREDAVPSSGVTVGEIRG